jgi:subtilisin family serine protease
MNRFLITAVALGLSATLEARPVVDPALEALFTSKADTEVRVIAEFKNPSFKRVANESIVQVQQRKRKMASQAQREVLAGISLMKKSSIKDLHTYWVDNSMALTAKVSFIRTLLERDEITEIYLDEKLTLFDPIKESSKAEDTDDSTYGLKKVRAMEVWEDLGIDGEGVVMGLLDTGIDKNHPDLAGRVLKTKDFVSDYEDDSANDGHGHGTHCAGTIGGSNTSGRSIGVAPKVKFIVAKIFSDSGSTTLSQIKDAMQWIVDPDDDAATPAPIRGVSNSWGGGVNDRFQAIIDTWNELGVAPIFAAGNSGPRAGSVGAPGAYPNVIAIGATDSNDGIARFSSRGPVSYQGETYTKPDVSAPGVAVYSAKNGGGYQKMSGTSMATPHTAGVVALMLQADPDISVERIQQILEDTAVDLGDEGMDNAFGWGRIDAYEAVNMVLSGGKAIVQVGSGDQRASITVNPGNKVFRADSSGKVAISLPAGTYELTISAFGYFSKVMEVTVVAKETVSASATLEPAPSFNASIVVRNSEGTALNARVSFVGVPIEGGSTNGGSLDVTLPGGDYTLKAKSVGYQTKTQNISVTVDATISIEMQDLPPYLVVAHAHGGNKTYETYYADSLQALGLGYDLVDIVTEDQIMGYQNVIWFTGSNSSAGIVNGLEQDWLKDYVNSGGRLFVSGQDFCYRLKGPFCEDFMGAKYISDTSKVKEVVGQGLEFKLYGGSSANNQKWPDVVKISNSAAETAKAMFTYKGKGPAGILNRYGAGKVFYLAFGFEGIDSTDNRNSVMEFVTNTLKSSVRDHLNRIDWAYRNDRRLYYLLLNGFDLTEGNRDEVHMDLIGRSHKAPFRALMGQLKGNL